MKLVLNNPRQIFFIDYFVNPLPAAAMLTMTLNDHWWKQSYPSWLTGKISDFAGVFYFPLFLCALICLARNFVFRNWSRNSRIAYITPTLMAVGMSCTAFLLIGVKLSPRAAQATEAVFSRLLFPIRLVADPTDLIALVFLPLSYLYARRFFGRGPQNEVDQF